MARHSDSWPGQGSRRKHEDYTRRDREDYSRQPRNQDGGRGDDGHGREETGWHKHAKKKCDKSSTRHHR